MITRFNVKNEDDNPDNRNMRGVLQIYRFD